jgi:hypothetical protein
MGRTDTGAPSGGIWAAAAAGTRHATADTTDHATHLDLMDAQE